MNVRGDSLLAALLGIVLLTWGASQALLRPPTPSSETTYRLDINAATQTDWLHVEGVGDTLAARIIEDRSTNGPFQSIDDLTRVRGIGEKTVVTMRPFLRADEVGVGRE